MKVAFDWDRFFSNWQKDLKVIVFLVGLLMIFRFAMVVVFHDQRAVEGEGLDYLLFFFRALRFDLRIVLMVVLPTFVLAFFALREDWSKGLGWLRLAIGTMVIVATVLLYIGDIGFFSEYHDQYNQWVYGLFHDDFKAIFETIWKTYPVVWIGMGIVILCYVCLMAFYYWMGKEARDGVVSRVLGNKMLFGWFGKWILLLLVVVVYVIGLRGSVLSRPLQRDDIGVTKDYFLNKLVANPYFALYYTHSDHKHLNQAAGLELFLNDKSIRDALVLLYPETESDSNQIDDWMKKTITNGYSGVRPKHIFLVVLESQDSWPLMEEFAWLDLAPNMRELVAKGMQVKSFVSAGSTTRTSLNAIITGLPDANIFTNFQPNSQNEYSTAFARPFKRLGYQVNLFYGGHLSWQRLGELARNQGFDNTYGREHMPLTAKGDSWGVFDEELFDYILKTVDGDIPSVNLIMTTSNHSPYPVNLRAKGCPQIVCPEKYSDLSKSFTEPRIMGHLWYNDYCIGRFVKEAEKRFESVLFAITGDHTSRRFFSSRPTLYEYKSVPLIFYGSKVFDGVAIPEGIAGSHLDILPTIIEGIGPEGFQYFALGSNLFDSKGRQIGLGADIAITTDVIWSIGGKKSLERLPWKKGDLSQTDTQYLDDLYNALHGVAWWRIMKGSEF